VVMTWRLKGADFRPIPLDQFMNNLKDGKVAQVTIEGDGIKGEFTEALTIKTVPTKVQKFRTELPANTLDTWQVVKWIYDNAPKNTTVIEIENTSNILTQLLQVVAPWLLLIALAWFFIFRQLRNSAGAGGMLGNFGKARAKVMSKEHTNITFDDVAGIEEAKEE